PRRPKGLPLHHLPAPPALREPAYLTQAPRRRTLSLPAPCSVFLVPTAEPQPMPLTVDIVTSERLVLSEEGVDEVVAPGIEGELTVLPMHAPLLTMIKPGVMRLKRGNDETDMAITGGFL